MTRLILCSLLSALLFLPTHAAEVPFPLPDPDGKPGDATKPIKVYILAGQSNMVGMGNLSGAKNVYDGVYLSSDPGVPDGPLQIYKVGNYKTAPLAVYLPSGQKTGKAIAEGQLEVLQHGVYQLHCGFGESSYNVMQLDGREVYRRESGKNTVKQEVNHKPGKRNKIQVSIV